MVPSCLLFVPGDRPERFAKALSAGAGGAIIDLEDAVAPDRKAEARANAIAELRRTNQTAAQRIVRINSLRLRTGLEDLLALADPRPDAVMVPKVESRGELEIVAALLPGVPIIAIVESVAGIGAVEEIARATGLAVLAFGNADLSAELGAANAWEPLLAHRARLVLAARTAGVSAFDGVTLELRDAQLVAADARRALEMGFDGKLAIHPAQVQPIVTTFAPSPDELERARKIVAAVRDGGVAAVDGIMVDPPVVTAARRVLQRAGQMED